MNTIKRKESRIERNQTLKRSRSTRYNLNLAHDPDKEIMLDIDQGDHHINKEEDCLLNDDSMIVTFQIVAKSNHLSTRDLGRLLLCTSKKLTSKIDNEIGLGWELLRKTGYRFSRELSNLPCPLKLLHCLSKTEPTPIPSPTIRPLKFSNKDYTVFISMFEVDETGKDLGGKALFSQCIDGDSIPSFFQNGEFTVEGNEEVKSCGWGRIWDEEKDVSISIHLLRSDGKCCCLVDNIIGTDHYENGIFFDTYESLQFQSFAYAKMLYEKATGIDDVVEGAEMTVYFDSEENMMQVRADLWAFDDLFKWNEHGGPNVAFAHLIEDLIAWEN